MSSKLRISTCASIDEVSSAMVTAGMTSDATPRVPVAGSQPSVKENSWISSSATKNCGNDAPIAGSRVSSSRSGRHRT